MRKSIKRLYKVYYKDDPETYIIVRAGNKKEAIRWGVYALNRAERTRAWSQKQFLAKIIRGKKAEIEV
jgi:hypothetical protein